MTRTVTAYDGWSVRRPHPTDGRQILVELTPPRAS